MGPGTTHTHLDVSGLRRLSFLLLSYVLLICVLCTLSPFVFVWPQEVVVDVSLLPRDVALNVLLLLPAGFLYQMSLPARVVSVGPFVFGLTVSVILEATQLLLPARCPSPFDIVFNTLGCWLGAALYRAVWPRLDGRLPGRLVLRLPLSNLFYLLTLQALVAALGVDRDGGRVLLLVPLTACGAMIAAALYTHRLRQAPLSSPWLTPSGMGAFVALWAFVCGLPAVPTFLLRVVVTALTGFAVTWALARSGFPRIRRRRFEAPTLAWLGPVFVGYLGGLAYCPWPAGVRLPMLQHLAVYPGLFDGPFARASAYSMVESMAAFTVVGYATSQGLGRLRCGGIAAAAMGAALLACLVELVRGLHPQLSARLLMPPLSCFFAAWGAAIHRAHLSVVRELLRGSTAWRRMPSH